MNYPILISVYDRLEHFKSCIESLQNNAISNNTIIYIASDAAKDNHSKEKIQNVRKYIKTISGFKEVILLDWDENKGQSRSIKDARDLIFQKYDGYIFLEDDNVVSPYFLDYMNYNLNYWKDDRRILYVCGYMYPINFTSNYDSVFLKEYNAWGVGVWKNKFIDVHLLDSDFFMNNPENLKLMKMFSNTSYYILMSDLFYQKNYADGRRAFTLIYKDAYSIFPRKSLVKNIGQDGSGLHSGTNKYLQKVELDKSFVPLNYPQELSPEQKIQSIITKYRRYSMLKRFRIHLGRIYNMFKIRSNNV